ncbi:AaceriACR114Cp [[Ashbya] aceris (nom. inval.)]|nr:AaceriACR114Cp [[Ashbya] aceris (nom. inval.)]
MVFGYMPLHLTNTLFIPLIEPTYAPNDVLRMVRELLPAATDQVLAWTVGVHVAAGVTLRVMSWYRRWRRRGRRYVTRVEADTSPRRIGLIGGLSGYFLGLNKTVRHSPHALSGYLLVPLLAYHAALMKWLPARVGVDVDFDFVQWLLYGGTGSAWTRWGLGIMPLAGLVSVGAYHMFTGLVQLFRWRSLELRRKIFNVVIGINVVGLVSLWRLSTVRPIMNIQYHRILQQLLWR